MLKLTLFTSRNFPFTYTASFFFKLIITSKKPCNVNYLFFVNSIISIQKTCNLILGSLKLNWCLLLKLAIYKQNITDYSWKSVCHRCLFSEVGKAVVSSQQWRDRSHQCKNCHTIASWWIYPKNSSRGSWENKAGKRHIKLHSSKNLLLGCWSEHLQEKLLLCTQSTCKPEYQRDFCVYHRCI